MRAQIGAHATASFPSFQPAEIFQPAGMCLAEVPILDTTDLTVASATPAITPSARQHPSFKDDAVRSCRSLPSELQPRSFNP